MVTRQNAMFAKAHYLAAGLLAAILVLGGALLAQTPTGGDLRCDRDELIATQRELHRLLDDFADRLDIDAHSTLADLYTTGHTYQELAIRCGYIPADIGGRFVGTDVDLILSVLETLNGDPLNGQLLYNNEVAAADGTMLGCVGCHSNVVVAPLTEGTWTRWDEIYSQMPQFAGYTFEHYIVESIIHPWDFIVEGYPENTMPNNYGDRLDFQNLADLIAYLYSQDQLLD